MASTAPWTVKTTKRKVAKITRKRGQAPVLVDDHADSRVKLRRQQTLTQILPNISCHPSFDDGELDEIKTVHRRQSKGRVSRLVKTNSTLTQMGFIGDKTMLVEMTDNDMKPLTVLAPNLATLPQLDGTYNSPRKPRPSKTVGPQRKRKSVSPHGEESQEFVLTTKRRKGQPETAGNSHQARPRRSTRHPSKVPSDPAENFAVFQEKLVDALPKSRTQAQKIKDVTGFNEDSEDIELPQQDEMLQQSSPYHRFEIQDSVESMNEDIEVFIVSPLKAIPKTPQKERHYVPSSQSPDSQPPSTKKRQNSPSKHKSKRKRNPLADISTNARGCRLVLDAETVYKSNPTSKKKACTLRKTSITLSSKKRLEDSHTDIWSVQPTSPPRKGDNQKNFRAAMQNEAMAEEELLVIPSSSQVRHTAPVTLNTPQASSRDAQESFPSVKTPFEMERTDTVNSKDQHPERTSRESTLKARDLVEQPQEPTHKAIQGVTYLDTQPQPSNIALQPDDGSDFGSPIANDTQFRADLLARIPTSQLTSDQLRDLNPHNTIHISSSSGSEDDARTSSLPVPILVDRVVYQNSTTTVPTKDLSSPILPPMPPSSQRSIVPAPLPHPSQISTQEPSQQLPQLSSVPQHSPARIDTITIKDSSSMHTPLSQLPRYSEDELQRELEQSQHIGPDEKEEDDDVDDDDDLDTRSPYHVARFQEPPPEPEPNEEKDAVPEPSPPSQFANFTQNGHVTEARIKNMRKRGLIPLGYQPPAYQVQSPREMLPAWMFEDDDDEEL